MNEKITKDHNRNIYIGQYHETDSKISHRPDPGRRRDGALST